MINQYQATSLLMESIEELATQDYPSQPSMALYATIIHFSDHTKKALTSHNIDEATKCFRLADHLFLFGDETVRSLIEDSFVLNTSAVIAHHKTDWMFLKATAPISLYQLYKKHMPSSD